MLCHGWHTTQTIFALKTLALQCEWKELSACTCVFDKNIRNICIALPSPSDIEGDWGDEKVSLFLKQRTLRYISIFRWLLVVQIKRRFINSLAIYVVVDKTGERKITTWCDVNWCELRTRALLWLWFLCIKEKEEKNYEKNGNNKNTMFIWQKFYNIYIRKLLMSF